MGKKNRKPWLGFLLPPKKKRGRVELYAAAGASLLVVCIFFASTLGRFLIGTDQYASVIAAVLVDLANGDRSSQSLGTLTVNPLLVDAAQAKADDMARYSYFAHVSPQGVSPWHWFKEAGYAFDYAGENLAVDFSDSTDVERAWMNSPTHRENIMDPHFTEIGIAIAQGTFDGHPTTFVVQEFGAPSGSHVAQASIQKETTPANPTQPALATAESAPSNTVLGTSASDALKEAPVALSAGGASGAGGKALATTPVVTTPVEIQASASNYAPWWAHILASPRSSMGYAYWMIGLLIVVGLGFMTGFEFHVHHLRKAYMAGALLAFVCLMFVAANIFIFTTPTLTPHAMMTASAAAAF